MYLTLLLLSCGAQQRPPPPGGPDSSPTAGTGGVGEALVGDGDVHPDTQSPCGRATAALEFQRPNLYFALDASGSMDEAIPTSPDPVTGLRLPQTRYDAMARAVETVLARVGHRVSYGASIFPAADTTCAQGEEIAPLSQGDTVSFAVGGEYGPILRSLQYSLRRRSPGGGTPIGPTLRSLVEPLSEQPNPSYVFLLTDGGPNCNTEVACGIERCMPNIEGVVLNEGQRCEAPLNCCQESLFGAGSCLDDLGSLEATQELLAAGVRTFVIGIPGSEAYADVLDQLAIAGGLPRAEPPYYYPASDADELTATVEALGRDAAISCTIELLEPPPDPDLVNVFFDGTVLAKDPEDGWRWESDQRVTLLGEACELFRTGQVLQADVVAGCPVVLY